MESKKLSFLFVVIILTFLIIPNCSAAIEVLKPAKYNESYTILQTCASCTYVNVTVSSVNGIIVSNKAMTDNGSGVWIYDITPTVVSRHDVTGQGDVNGVDTSFATFFEVTPSGKVANTGDSLLYALFSFILFLLILGITFFIWILPSSNEKDDRGWENQIVKLKYIRILLIGVAYALVAVLLNFLTGLAVNFTALSMFEGMLGGLFLLVLRGAWPVTVILIVWTLYMLIHDTNVKRGLNEIMSYEIGK